MRVKVHSVSQDPDHKNNSYNLATDWIDQHIPDIYYLMTDAWSPTVSRAVEFQLPQGLPLVSCMQKWSVFHMQLCQGWILKAVSTTRLPWLRMATLFLPATSMFALILPSSMGLETFSATEVCPLSIFMNKNHISNLYFSLLQIGATLFINSSFRDPVIQHAKIVLNNPMPGEPTMEYYYTTALSRPTCLTILLAVFSAWT